MTIPNVFSVGACLAAALIGYYSLAGFSNVLFPEGSLGGILIRLIFSVQLMLMFFLNARHIRLPLLAYLSPGILFFFIYFARMMENVVVQGIDIEPDNVTAFSIFFGSTVIPSIVLALFATRIQGRDLSTLMWIFSALFVIGLTLNYQALMATIDQRLSLDRINPIQLAYTSISILFFFYLSLERKLNSRLVLVAVATPILVLIVFYSQSRGPLVSSAAALLIYLMLLPGTSRLWSFFYISIFGGGLLVWNYDLASTTIFGMIERTNVRDMSTYHHMIASQGAWAQFWEDPLFGRWVIELQTQFYPHNIYVESLMSVGIFGTLPFVAHMVLAIRSAIGVLRDRAVGIVGSLLVFLFIRESFAGGISGGIWGSSLFWVISFVLIGLWYGRDRTLRRAVTRAREIQQPLGAYAQRR